MAEKKAKKTQEEVTGHTLEAPAEQQEALAAPEEPKADVAPVPASDWKKGPILRGEKGPRVLAVQGALLKHSYLLPRSLKADGSLDGIAGPELIIGCYNYALERKFSYHDDEWTSIPEAVVTQLLSEQPVYARGVDVARYQPGFDMAQAKRYGTSFAFIKATDITNDGGSFTDSLFRTHWQSATDAGMAKGAYLFWHPALDPVKQANYFIAQTKALYQPGDLRPVIDVERNDKMPAKEVNRRLQLLIDTLKAHFGVAPIIYTSRRVCLEQGITVGGECPVWLAFYVDKRDVDPGAKKDFRETFRVGPPVPAQWKDWDIWQSGYGKVLPGLRDDLEIDRNLAKTSMTSFRLV